MNLTILNPTNNGLVAFYNNAGQLKLLSNNEKIILPLRANQMGERNSIIFLPANQALGIELYAELKPFELEKLNKMMNQQENKKLAIVANIIINMKTLKGAQIEPKLMQVTEVTSLSSSITQ